MITIDISVNGKTIFARSAHRRTKRHARKNKVTKKLEQAYLVDNGEVIYHDPDDGIIPLSLKLVRTIKET